MSETPKTSAHGISMDLDAHYKTQHWPANRIGGLLTDRKIEHYRRNGFYSEDFRGARRDIWAKRKKKRDAYETRDGNFIKTDGRLIYNPI